MLTFRDDLMLKDPGNLTTVRLQTTLGGLEIAWRDGLLVYLAWLPQSAAILENSQTFQSLNVLGKQQRELAEDLVDYAAGTQIDFSQVAVDFGHATLFQRKIWQACQKIPYGHLVTYGELARKAGRPGAARAVGTAMSQNRVPIIVPCHRVIAAGNKIGGFTSPDGIGRKKQLLDMEFGGQCPVSMPEATISRKRK